MIYENSGVKEFAGRDAERAEYPHSVQLIKLLLLDMSLRI